MSEPTGLAFAIDLCRGGVDQALTDRVPMDVIQRRSPEQLALNRLAPIVKGPANEQPLAAPIRRSVRTIGKEGSVYRDQVKRFAGRQLGLSARPIRIGPDCLERLCRQSVRQHPNRATVRQSRVQRHH
jgi:hypothetical protein